MAEALCQVEGGKLVSVYFNRKRVVCDHPISMHCRQREAHRTMGAEAVLDKMERSFEVMLDPTAVPDLLSSIKSLAP
jgi:hypothetical protein